MWRMILAHPATILAEIDIEYPMQAVLDPPVAACCLGEGLGARHALAADVEGTLGGHGALDVALPLDHADAGQPGPVLPEFLVHPGQVGDPKSLAGLDPAMAFLDGMVAADRQGTESAGVAVGKELPQGIGQGALVILDGQQVIPAPVENLLGDPGLAADGIEGDDANPRDLALCHGANL